MELEKYTERSKGLSRAAQNGAAACDHQRLTPEHLLKILLDDKEGLCANLINAAGGDAKAASMAVEAELNRQPKKVEGSGAGQVYMSPELARVFEQAEQIAEKAGDSFVTVERMLLALAMTKELSRRQDPRQRRRDAARASTPRSSRYARAARPTARRARTAMTR